jgi:hypothetical protein
MPGDGSQSRRQRSLAEGCIAVDDKVYARLVELAR